MTDLQTATTVGFAPSSESNPKPSPRYAMGAARCSPPTASAWTSPHQLAARAATADPSKVGVLVRHAAAPGGGQQHPPEAIPAATNSALEDEADPTACADYWGSRARREHYQALEAQRV